MSDEFSAHDVALKEEYFHLNKVVEDFDQRALLIKGWSVTVSMAGVAAVYSGKVSAAVFILAAVASLMFWFIEALWKGFQQAYYPRLRAIEDHFNGGTPLPCLQINKNWTVAYLKEQAPKRVLEVMLWPHVAFPHVVILVFGIALWIAKIVSRHHS
jgi:uncharacterized membrane protein